MLYNEARELPLRMNMVAHDKLTREKRCATRLREDETLRVHWDGYKKWEISLREMFDRIVADIKSPSLDISQDGLDYDRFIADEWNVDFNPTRENKNHSRHMHLFNFKCTNETV